MEALDMILKYAVVPLLAFVYGLHMRQNTTSTDLKVMEATMLAEKRAHDVEMKNLHTLLQKVFDRLENLDEKLTKLIVERSN